MTKIEALRLEAEVDTEAAGTLIEVEACVAEERERCARIAGSEMIAERIRNAGPETL